MVSVCLPSDALLQHLPSYLGFSYLGHGVSLHGCSSKARLLLLTLDEGYLLTTAVPDLQHGIAPLGPPVPAQPLLLGLLLPAAGPSLGHGWLLGGATPRPRSGGCTGKESLEEPSQVEGQEGWWEEIPLIQGKEQWLCFAGTAMKRYPMPMVRDTPRPR